MKITTTYVYPPIPDRRWDWSAVDDNTYEPGGYIGQGPTEAAAIADLFGQMLDNDEDISPCQRGAPCRDPRSCLDPIGCGQAPDDWWQTAQRCAVALGYPVLTDLSRLALGVLRDAGRSPYAAAAELFVK